MCIYVLKEKKLISLPVLYWEAISTLVDDRRFRNFTDFADEAVKEKLLREGVQLELSERLELDDCFYK